MFHPPARPGRRLRGAHGDKTRPAAPRLCEALYTAPRTIGVLERRLKGFPWGRGGLALGGGLGTSRKQLCQHCQRQAMDIDMDQVTRHAVDAGAMLAAVRIFCVNPFFTKGLRPT